MPSSCFSMCYPNRALGPHNGHVAKSNSDMVSNTRRRRTDAVADSSVSWPVDAEDTWPEWLPPPLHGSGWKARGDREPTDKRVPFNKPTAKQIYESLPFVRRYFLYWMKYTFDKEKLFINTFQPLRHTPFYGVPCGGIGCGAMGRDFRGGFCKFSLRPGLVEHNVEMIPANQFILTVRQGEECVYQKVLCAASVPRSGSQLSAWDFSFPKTDVYYRGLYPRSWTAYCIPDLRIIVVIRQISPVIPDDYEDSSLPTTCFVVEVHNQSANEYEVSVTLSFRNGTGDPRWEREAPCMGVGFDDGNIKGVQLVHSISQMPCTYGIATSSNGSDATVSICKGFDPSKSGSLVWDHLKKSGTLPEREQKCAEGTRELAVAVSSKLNVPSSQTKSLEFSLSWDMPYVAFGSEGRTYRRRYTRFVGCGEGALALCRRSLIRRKMWEEKIENWQGPVLSHALLPEWYKSAVFNELYFMTDGGSLWFEFDDKWSSSEKHLNTYTKELMRRFGRFGYLESWEYRMVNTYDVHFYASYALACLWPKLELTVQAEFTDHVEHSIETSTKFHMEGDIANLKTIGRVPHDLGNPADDPWLFTNAYIMHDTGKWKDLNLKYVLTSWRDLVALALRDQGFLEHTWPAVKLIMNEALTHWDQDGDGMIENFGKADQTYDAWRMEGVSAYCGSLWLAALRVAAEMATLMGDEESRELFTDTLKKAKEVFISTLWTGEYFRLCERSRSRESVMADQLCGIWFLQSVSPELIEDILPMNMINMALQKIYSMNVCSFGNGELGAVNGMRPDGRVDREYIQADEVWTGVTYAVAAFLIQQGRLTEGFHTASGCYKACFERFGLQYQTPEALYETRYYRAIGYMRPLSIWAMQWALERHCGLNTSKDQLRTLLTPNNIPVPPANGNSE